MWVSSILFATFQALFAGATVVRINDTAMGMKFLHQFGYITDKEMSMESGKEKSVAMESAIMMYQEYNHLEPTGQMDQKTMSMMESPRCGNSDKSVVEQMHHAGRRKRYATKEKWEKSTITYKFKNYARCCLTKDEIEKEFEFAIEIWMSAISNKSLKLIKEKNDHKPVDIDIVFAEGPHHDDMSFAEMNTLAHAFYPQQPGNHYLRGDIHFNDEVNWTSGKNQTGQTFLQTACHELGHSLGLQHSMTQKAVMFAHVDHYIPNFDLHLDDVQGIQSLYGIADSKNGKDEPDLETSESGWVETILPPPVLPSQTNPTPKSLPQVHQDALTKSSSIFPNFVLPRDRPIKKEPRILPQFFKPSRKEVPEIRNENEASSKNFQNTEESDDESETLETETKCRDYLMTNQIHTSKRSFLCLQFLWMQFYYYHQNEGFNFVKIDEPR